MLQSKVSESRLSEILYRKHMFTLLFLTLNIEPIILMFFHVHFNVRYFANNLSLLLAQFLKSCDNLFL